VYGTWREAKTVTCPTFLAPQDPRRVGENKPLGDPLMSTGPDSGKWWRGKKPTSKAERTKREWDVKRIHLARAPRKPLPVVHSGILEVGESLKTHLVSRSFAVDAVVHAMVNMISLQRHNFFLARSRSPTFWYSYR
jgi:hypothetical protein